jgi:hypothetical protein
MQLTNIHQTTIELQDEEPTSGAQRCNKGRNTVHIVKEDYKLRKQLHQPK